MPAARAVPFVGNSSVGTASQGATVDFYLSRTRDVRAAKLFLRKAMADARRVEPEELVIDGNPTYPIAMRALQREGVLAPSCRWRCSHEDNNLIEQDHRFIQWRLDAKQRFRSFAVVGFEFATLPFGLHENPHPGIYEAGHLVERARAPLRTRPTPGHLCLGGASR